MSTLDDILNDAHRARLIPSIADSRKEQRTVSILLATLSVVRPLAAQLLESCEFKLARTAELQCYTWFWGVHLLQRLCVPPGFPRVSPQACCAGPRNANASTINAVSNVNQISVRVPARIIQPVTKKEAAMINCRQVP